MTADQAHPWDGGRVCPGCGGRNPEPTDACNWCGRPFETRSPRYRRLVLASAIALICIALGAVGWFFLQAALPFP